MPAEKSKFDIPLLRYLFIYFNMAYFAQILEAKFNETQKNYSIKVFYSLFFKNSQILVKF